MKTGDNYRLGIEKKVGRAVNRYSLIKENDFVAVALSGGKDSYVMLEALALRRRRLPVTYRLAAVHVYIRDIGYEADLGFMQGLCDELSVPLEIIETDADSGTEPVKSRCFVCSWKRRKVLFDFCMRESCNSLALGHHMDDAVETLIMNMMYNGTMSSMPPLIPLFKGRLNVIRPLILLSEKEIEEYSRLSGFPPSIRECPYSGMSKRSTAKKIISLMKEESPDAVRNLFRSMSNIHGDYLPPVTED